MLELIKIETQKNIISTLDVHHALTANIVIIKLYKQMDWFSIFFIAARPS